MTFIINPFVPPMSWVFGIEPLPQAGAETPPSAPEKGDQFTGMAPGDVGKHLRDLTARVEALEKAVFPQEMPDEVVFLKERE